MNDSSLKDIASIYSAQLRSKGIATLVGLGVFFLLAGLLWLLPTPELAAGEETVSSEETSKETVSSEETVPSGSSSQSTLEETLLADFAEGLTSRFGLGWAETTDDRMGGKSVVELAVHEGALHVTGEIIPGAMFPWAGAMVFPGDTPMGAVDFSHREELHFRVRGDGRRYSVMVFSGEMQGIPPSQNFQAKDGWSTVVLPLDQFRGADTATLRGIAFTATSPPGKFQFEIDDVEIR